MSYLKYCCFTSIQNIQMKKLSSRSVSVKTRGLSLTAIYWPVNRGNNENEIEIEMDRLVEHKEWRDVFIGGGVTMEVVK